MQIQKSSITLFTYAIMLSGCTGNTDLTGTYIIDKKNFFETNENYDEGVLHFDQFIFLSEDSLYIKTTIEDAYEDVTYTAAKYSIKNDSILYKTKKGTVKKIHFTDSTLQRLVGNGQKLWYNKVSPLDKLSLKSSYPRYIKEKIAKEKRQNRLDSSFVMSLTKKVTKYRSQFYVLEIKNTSKKDIEAFKMQILIEDKLNTQLDLTDDMVYDNPIKADSSQIILVERPLDHSNRNHVKIAKSRLDKLVFTGSIKEILFADGERLKL